MQEKIFGRSSRNASLAEIAASLPTGSSRAPRAFAHFDEQALSYLLEQFIVRGHITNLWRILRFYGYDRDLKLRHDYLQPKLLVKLDGHELIELSKDGWVFVQELWLNQSLVSHPCLDNELCLTS